MVFRSLETWPDAKSHSPEVIFFFKLGKRKEASQHPSWLGHVPNHGPAVGLYLVFLATILQGGMEAEQRTLLTQGS